jgi:hypothetical protein
MRQWTKVRKGFYRCGPYCIHRGTHCWTVFKGPEPVLHFLTLKAARAWALGRPSP